MLQQVLAEKRDSLNLVKKDMESIVTQAKQETAQFYQNELK